MPILQVYEAVRHFTTKEIAISIVGLLLPFVIIYLWYVLRERRKRK